MTAELKPKILEMNAAVPRYTSYPPATAFTPVIDENIYRSWLAHIKLGSLFSLYIHIPFCKKLCYYCGCHTTITQNNSRIESYIDNLIRELDIIHTSLPQNLHLSHLHFGGGSPTILNPSLFAKLMEAIRSRFTFSPNAEIALEADPRQMGEERIATFAKHGVTRISLGLQDVDQSVLAAVNRKQPFHLSWDAVNLCRTYGINQINLDLMYGLPGQTIESIARTIDIALSLKPQRVAFFGYAHVPWMKKHMQMIDQDSLPDSSQRYDLYETGSTILKQAGYLPVGIDHFVQPSDSMAHALHNRTLQRNFQGYTTDTAKNLIGLGASAIGKLPEGYIQNIADLRLYHKSLEDSKLPVNKGFILQPEHKIQADIISDLMCYLELDLKSIANRHNLDMTYFNPALERLSPLLENGLATYDGSFIQIKNPHLARLSAACFDPMLAHKTLTNKHSQAV